MKTLLTLFVLFFSSSVISLEVGGTAWMLIEEDNDQTVIFFELDGSLTYLNLVSNSGNQGMVYSNDSNTWFVNEDKLVISYNDGYMIVSLSFDDNKDNVYGSYMNKAGKTEKIIGYIIN